MSLIWIVYFAGIVKDVSCLLTISSLVSVGVLFGYSMYCVDYEVKPKIRYYFIPVVLGAFAVITPSRDTIYLMVAADIGQKIATSDKANAILDKVYKIVDKELDKKLNPSKE